MFCLEINAYFAVKFRYENPFASAQNLRKAVLCCVNIRMLRQRIEPAGHERTSQRYQVAFRGYFSVSQGGKG